MWTDNPPFFSGAATVLKILAQGLSLMPFVQKFSYGLLTVVIFLVLFLFAATARAQMDSLAAPPLRTFMPADSVVALKDTSLAAGDTALTDSARKANARSATLDSLKKKGSIEERFKYTANDSIVFDLDSSVLYLYNKAKLKYQQMEMEAERVRVEWRTNLVYAEGIPDSTGELKETPIFKEKDQTYYTERMRYNYKTRKGKIAYARTNQEGDVVLGDSIKRNPDNTYYIKDGKFTTCDADHPHFFIRSKKMKVIPKDKIVSGPLYMVIADIPTPLALPFGFFPFKQSRQSGIIFPEPGVAADRGFFLRNGGYYWPVNDYLDLKLTGDFFSEGGFRAEIGSNYRKRYRFDGTFSFEYARLTYNEKTDPDFRGEQYFFIRWRHNQPISPTASLTADVNAGSSKFLQRVSLNIANNLQNTLQSSVNFNKRFPRAGWQVSLNVSSRQELASGTVQLVAPRLVFNRDRFYPFKGLGAATGKTRWYEQIGVSYNSELQNSVTTRDSLLFKPEGQRAFRNGMRHGVGINTNFKLLKYITLTPAFALNEYWYLRTIEKIYDRHGSSKEKDTLYNRDVWGFSSGRDFNLSLNANTNIYGVKQTRARNGLAFRHTLQPSVGYRYQPDFSKANWGYYHRTQVDSTGKTGLYSKFENAVYGGPSFGEQQSLNFGLNNIVEMKYLPRDTAQAKDATGKKKYKYLTIMDAIGANASYNLAADSLKLSTVNIYARNNILNNKVNLNFSGSLDPYALDAEGRKYDRFQYTVNKSLFRFTNASFSISTNYSPGQNKKKEKEKEKNEKKKDEKTLAPKEAFEKLYQPFSMPLTFSASYTMSYSKPGLLDGKLTHSINLNGTWNLTAKWSIRFSTNYDMENKRFGLTTMNITRDLHCWQMTMDVTPFGQYQRYLLTIGVKGRSLQDLKLQKRREWQDQFTRF